MTAVICWEFSVGQNGLPAAYPEFFTGQFQRLLKDDGITKSQWLISIWNAQYHIRITSGLGGWERNQMPVNFIQRHKKRREKNWRNGIL